MNVPSPLRRWAPVCLTVVVGLCYRLWLMTRYAGWEESDYGNLAMVRGVLDGGFLHYDMNHMPGYYAVSAIVLVLVGDTVVAAKTVSLVGGVVALGLAVGLMDRMAGRVAAILSGILLLIQPEFSLYAATSLREPLYAAWIMGVLWSLSRERLVAASLFGALAFSVRFDGGLAMGLVLLVHGWGQGFRIERLLRALGPLVLAVAGWSLYCRFEHGTFLFWSHSVQVNLETGMGGEATGGLEWLMSGGATAAHLLFWLLPDRIGWLVLLGLLVTLATTPWKRHGMARTWATAAVALTSLWLGIGVVGQHAPTHNLYWKWLCPLVPVLVPLGASGLLQLAERLERRQR